jgi:NMD protein affecting ribosome stability and mRNA decay
MNDMYFCHKCNKYTNHNIEIEILKNFKNYEINTPIKVAICNQCNERNWSEYESENLKNIYTKYRKLTNVITSEELNNFLEKFNISTERLSELSGVSLFKINSIKRGGCAFVEDSNLLRQTIFQISNN